jgi:SAM-dependent methyltransferase
MSAQSAQPGQWAARHSPLAEFWLRVHTEERPSEDALGEPIKPPDPLMEAVYWETLSAYFRSEAEPFTFEWYLALEQARYGRHAQWLADFLGFHRHRGETVLFLGRTLGTNGIQFARHGAKVIVSHSVWADLEWARRNFALRGLAASFIHSQPNRLPLAGSSVDVAVLSQSLLEDGSLNDSVAEALRVLRPGGKLLAIFPAGRPRRWAWLRRGQELPVRRPASLRLARELHAHCVQVRFKQRHLRTRNLLWFVRWLPRSWLERLVGDFLLCKGFKPITWGQSRIAA